MSAESRRIASAAAKPTDPEASLRIGDVAREARVSVDALRFYERRGLLPTARRRPSGYREYSHETVRLVRFIRRAQSLGFTLAEVEDLVRLRERAWAGDGPRQLREAAGAKVRDIDRRVRELRALRGALSQLISACDELCPTETTSPPSTEREPNATNGCCEVPTKVAALDCPLIEALEEESEPSTLQATGNFTESSRSSSPGRRSAQQKLAPGPIRTPSTRRKR